MISILIVDDHTLFRDGLMSIIKHWDGFDVCGEASNGVEALEIAHEVLPDIILMDINMPKMDGIEATRRLSRELPSTRIVMLTISEEEDDLFNAIKNGAQGYILKDTPSKRLRDELRKMLVGETPLSGLMATKVMDEFARVDGLSQSNFECCESLTEREQQVLELLVEGNMNSEIAESMHLSTNTIKKHIHNIMEKLHLNNRVETAVYALRKGLVD